MGKYLRKRKGAAELAAVDVGPLTRARKTALLASAKTAVLASAKAAAGLPAAGGKKRKLAAAAAATGGELGKRRSSSCRNEGGAEGLVAAEDDDRCRDRSREATPSAANSALRNSPAAKAAGMPTAEEIDAFFSAAEMREKARFADKYNFDVEKETPFEGGRYEWMPFK